MTPNSDTSTTRRQSNLVLLGTGLLVAGFFIFTRWYKIESTLFFFNDIGRDYLVLFDWWKTGKPPLLGPQNSAIAYNQSAVYFYMLFPLFVLLQKSALATLATLTLVYIAVFLGGLFLLRNKHQLAWSWILLFLFFSIHPEMIAQNRYVWNPSFVPLSLGFAFLSWSQLRENWHWKWAATFSFSLSLATAFSYSAAPIFAAWVLYILGVFWSEKRKIIQLGAYIFISLAALNLPLFVFELRHGFVLTKLIFTYEKLPQTNLHWLDKTQSLLNYVIYSQSWLVAGIALGFSLLVVALSTRKDEPHPWLKDSLSLFGLTYIVTLIVPFAILKHYIFPLLTLWLIAVSTLRKSSSILVGAVLGFLWLQPWQIQAHLKTPPRTLAETTQCAELLCSQVQYPIFVSNQSSFHVYHNAMEFRFFFSAAGCDVKKIETEPDQANHMVVVLDDSEYMHNKTAFNELTLFGPSNETDRIMCNDKLELVLLEKQ